MSTFDVALDATNGSSVTSITTASGTIAATADRAAALFLYHAANTSTAFSATCGGVSGALVSGTDTTNARTFRTQIWRVIAPASGSQTANMQWTTAVNCYLGAAVWNDVDQTTPFINGTFATGASGTPTLTPSGTGADASMCCEAYSGTVAGRNQTLTNGPFTGHNEDFESTRGAAGATHSYTDNSAAWAMSGVGIADGANATYEQEGFRFRNDDGSETTATWQQAQDTDTTSPLSTNLRLRALINAGASVDPPANAYTLRYKKSTDSDYIAVLTAQPSLSRAEITAGASTANTATYTTASVTLTAGRLYVMGVVTSDTASEQALTSIATTGGAITFSSLDSQTYDTVATNVHRLSVWYAQPTSTVTATITITPNDAATGCAWILQEYQNAADSPFGTPVKTGINASTTVTATPGALAAATSHQIAFGAHDLNLTGDTASGTNWASVGTGQTYATPSTGLECAENTSGSASQVTFSGDGSADRACIAVEIKVKVHPILVSASANITAGGEDTTFQLSAPTGKATSDFVTGRMWDNENGSDTIDLTTDDYTELEWCLIAASPAANGDIYQFRVYNGSTALNTYTVTPQWTIGTAGASIHYQRVIGGGGNRVIGM